MRVDAVADHEATHQVLVWSELRTPKYVCVANVHMTMESWDDDAFRTIVNGADLVVPDGMPLVWALRLLGVRSATRVRGPDLMRQVVVAAARTDVPIAFYGGSQDVLTALVNALRVEVPNADIRLAISPPYRPLTPEEQLTDLDRLRDSGARIIFVGLGCPKQERWMAATSAELAAVLIGVGAAFDFHAGTVKEAPRWLQNAGLEWLFRLSQEPKRLWGRYLRHNPRFVGLLLLQLAGLNPRPKTPPR